MGAGGVTYSGGEQAGVVRCPEKKEKKEKKITVCKMNRSLLVLSHLGKKGGGKRALRRFERNPK